MSSATISGTVVFPTALGGPDTSLYLGSPSISSASTTGPVISFNEASTTTLSIPTAAPTTLPFATVTSGSLVYIGCSTPCSLILNAGAESISIAANGFVLLSNCGITSATLQADSTVATVTFCVWGD